MSYEATQELYRALELRFAAPAYALLTNVSNGTGGNITGWADAIAMSLWPSRGISLWGFELKSDRADWLRELKKPAKAEAFVKYCDHWCVVATRDVVRKDELPPTWGLLVLRGKKLFTEVEQPVLEPQPLQRAQLAAILRRVSEGQAAACERARQEGLERGRTMGPEEFAQERGILNNRINNLTHTIETFEKASGVEIKNTWRLGDIGKVVHDLLEHRLTLGTRTALDALERTQTACRMALRHVDQEIAYQKQIAEAAPQLLDEESRYDDN